MSKQMKFGLLPAAIAGALLSGNAFAGTEACIEVFKTADNAYPEHNILYTNSACEINTGWVGAGDATNLRASDPALIAYELTKDFDYDLEQVSNKVANAADTLNIVYVPTTDIPPATRLVFKLNGATFANNNDIIHLVTAETDANNATTQYTAVASTDGAVDGETEITFIVKSGVTVGAGSRLVLSLNNQPTLADRSTFTSPGINIANPEQCTTEDEVTLEVISALTDNDKPILGAVTSAPRLLVDIQKQFALAQNSDATTEADVNAESPSYRTEFVWEKDTNGAWENQTTTSSLVWETHLIDNEATLDQVVTLQADDELKLRVAPTAELNGKIALSVVRGLNGATAKDTGESDHVATTGERLEFNEDSGLEWATLPNTSTAYYFDAIDAFENTLTNSTPITLQIANPVDGNGAFAPMTFNYDLNAEFGLQFADVTMQDDNYCETRTPFEVGVNGAVLKVPYAYNTANNWVRITNEHTTEAEVTVEVFDENFAEGDKRVLTLGKVGADDSTVYKADAIIDLYEAEIGRTSSNRVSMTFTVTAPKNSVHGVSVQAIPGGVDRVMPVLDQNDWSQ